MYYEVTVTIIQEGKNGGKKKAREVSLVNAVSVTDVDKKMNEKFNGFTLEWSITNCKESRIIEVIK